MDATSACDSPMNQFNRCGFILVLVLLKCSMRGSWDDISPFSLHSWDKFKPLNLSGGSPIAGWFKMEHPTVKWMISGVPFWQTSICPTASAIQRFQFPRQKSRSPPRIKACSTATGDSELFWLKHPWFRTDTTWLGCRFIQNHFASLRLQPVTTIKGHRHANKFWKRIDIGQSFYRSMGIPRHYKHHWNPPFVPLSLHGPESQQRCGLRILAKAKDPLVNFIVKFPLKWIYDDYDDICSGHTPFSDTPRQDIKCMNDALKWQCKLEHAGSLDYVGIGDGGFYFMKPA